MEIVLRITIIYLFVLITLHVIGKREFGQLSPFELVTLLLIPEIASNSLMQADYSLTGGLIGLSTLFGLVFLLTLITHMSKRAERIVEGKSMVLVSHGRFIEDALHRERVNPDEIYVELHKAGLERLDQVRWAILENDGKISIVPEGEWPVRKKEESGSL